jgi:hypothetical protein
MDYGAYQLRRDYLKSSLTALLSGLLLLAVLGLLTKVNWHTHSNAKSETDITLIIGRLYMFHK